MAGRLVAPPACSALTVGPVCRPDADALAVEPLPSARSQASRYAGGPSFDDVQDLGSARKFFPAHEFMRQALYPPVIADYVFRFYGPEKPLFDKTWKLPDIERITAQ